MGKIQNKRTVVSDVRGGTRKRWAKGHSSDCNPSIRLHRNAAKNRFYYPQNNDKELKVRDMKMLENMDLNLNDSIRDDETTASDADTVATRLSNITNCTNPTFDKVHRIWKSGSKLHTDVLTVLATVTDVIKSKGGKENEIEYFAALLNLLTDAEYSTNLVAATGYLINLVIPKVPMPILLQQFHGVADIVYSALRRIRGLSEDSSEIDSHETAIIRYLLSSLGYLLHVLPPSVWSSSPYKVLMVKIVDTILKFITHDKARIRKSAQKAIVQIVVGGTCVPASVSERCSEFCIQQIESFSGTLRGKKANVDSTLHVLNLLQHILHRFAPADLKKCTETVFKLLTLSDSLTTAVAVRCLYIMFRNRPSSNSLSGDLNAKIIMAIYDFQPSPKDGRACSNWILLITEAHGSLLEKDLDLAADCIPKLTEVLAACLANTDHAEIISAAADSLKKIYSDYAMDLAKSSRHTTCLEKCLETLENLLSTQYYSIWPHVYGLLAAFFQAAGSTACVELRNFKRCLRTIAELRETDAFPCKLPAEQAIGAAVRFVGPEEVLAAIPLGLNVQAPSLSVLDFRRSWLLLVLRTSVRCAKISFFASYFLPLAIKIEERVKELRTNDDSNVEAKVLESTEFQIWDVLPAFCNRPTDVLDPLTARALGAALIGRPKLRLSILSALRKLIQQENGDNVKLAMAKFAGNYLNILLQLYTRKRDRDQTDDCDNDGSRLAILQTVRAYLTVTSDGLIGTYLEEVTKRLKMDDVDGDGILQKKCRLMDILILLIRYLNSDQKHTVYELVVEFMSTGDKAIQKKCWKLMEELCSGNSEANTSFVSNHLPVLQSQLRLNLSTAAPSTKACRLRCLTRILDVLKESDDDNSSFISSVLQDAVHCLHGSSVKARKFAAKFIVKTVVVLSTLKMDTDIALRIIFDKILEIANTQERNKGSVQEITGSIIAARILSYEFRNDISTDLVSSVLGKVCGLLRSDDRRSVVRACVEYLKTFVGCFPEITVGQFLDIIVSALCNQNEDCTKHCRRLTRKVMAKLVKRFSSVTIRKFVPDAYEKQLNNIRKLVARSERRAAANAEGKKQKGTTSTISSDDDECGSVFTTFTSLSRPETIADLLKDTSDEESSEDERKSKRGRKTPSVWLKEGDEEEVVDLMDKKLVQQILTTKPEISKSNTSSVVPASEKNRGFKTAPDGRLIITEEKEEIDDRKKGNKRKRQDSMESVDDDTRGRETRVSEKRVRFDDDEDEGAEGMNEGSSTYVPGGRGIHRRLAESSKAAKRAKGDKKTKTGLEPYAYVPLNKKALNNRKRVKLGGQLKHIVQGAKKGATKGSKGRKKK